MVDVLADNFVIFDYGVFPLADYEHTTLEHCNILLALQITRNLAPFEVKLGYICLSRILQCKKENDGWLPGRHQIMSKTYLGLGQVSMKWIQKHRSLI